MEFPDFEKFWLTLVATRGKGPKALAARAWVAVWTIIILFGIITTQPKVLKYISALLPSDSRSVPSQLKDNSKSSFRPSHPSPSAKDTLEPLPALCIKLKNVASDYNLSDTNDHLAAKAALDNAIAGFPLLEKRVFALPEWKNLDEQWISGNPSVALSRLLVALNCS